MQNPMQRLARSFLPAWLVLTACGAAADGFDNAGGGDPGSEANPTADGSSADLPATDEPELGTTQQPLISSGGLGGLNAKPWCAARKECYDQCDVDYPRGGGPLTTCKQLCDLSTASKCRPGLATSGAVLF